VQYNATTSQFCPTEFEKFQDVCEEKFRSTENFQKRKVKTIRLSSMRKPIRIAFGISIAFVTIIVCIAVWFVFGDSIQERLNRLKFDSVTWRAGSGFTNSVRIRMVDDLLQRHQFIGTRQEEVILVLGQPDETNHFGNWNMIYHLGPERGFISIDDEWLVFRLDNQKKVAEYRIVSD